MTWVKSSISIRKIVSAGRSFDVCGRAAFADAQKEIARTVISIAL